MKRLTKFFATRYLLKESGREKNKRRRVGSMKKSKRLVELHLILCATSEHRSLIHYVDSASTTQQSDLLEKSTSLLSLSTLIEPMFDGNFLKSDCNHCMIFCYIFMYCAIDDDILKEVFDLL